jgi:glutathione peroxidase
VRLHAAVRWLGEIISPLSRQRFYGAGISGPQFRRAGAGSNANPLFRELAAKTGKAPRWNFHKYLVDRAGQPVAVFESAVEPEDRQVIAQIEKLLGAR